MSKEYFTVSPKNSRKKQRAAKLAKAKKLLSPLEKMMLQEHGKKNSLEVKTKDFHYLKKK